MKQKTTLSLIALLMFFVTQLSFGQNTDDAKYQSAKANFYKTYLQYKENLKTNPFTNKPTDPSGLFRIDEQNNFTSGANTIQPVTDNQSGPWITPQPSVVTAYTWAQTSGTYTPISGGTSLGTTSNDDNTFAATNIGFNFLYDGVTYSTIDINANGYIKFGTSTTSYYPNILSLQTNIFTVFNSDLRGNNTTSNLQYLLTGSVGSRVLTIQWTSYGFYNGTLANWDGSDMSFQIKLYETSNSLQVVYGGFPTITTPTYTTAQVGMNTILTDFNCRTTATDWTATTAGGTNTAGCTITAAIKPVSGLTYTWSAPPMTYTSSNTVQVQSGQTIHRGTTNNQIIQVQVVTAGGSAALTAGSFSFGTTGSTNPGTDITNAKLYFTGNSSTFATTTLVGTQVSPSGTFVMPGTQALSLGTNYFWLTYDVPVTASIGDLVDAECNSVNIGGTQIPSTTAPAGNRPISAVLAPFCGTINIPGDYANLTDCFTDLNTVGVTCPTTVNIAAGYTESNVNLVLTCPTNAPNATNTLTFKRSGIGANPLLTAGVGTSTTTDGIIKLNGVNYVTFDGIDLQENAANVTATTQMEWGYALVKQSAALACQHITIQNCAITLNKANTASTCIYTGNHLSGSVTALTITSITGTASYNHFYNNTVQNSYFGYQVQGYNSALPYDFYDQGNEIGTISGGRSQVLNFGGSTVQSIGINAIYQNGMKIFNTNINGGTGTTSNVYGIFGQAGINSNIDIYGDTVTVSCSSTASGTLAGIANAIGTTGTGNTVNIYNNVVTNCTYTTNTAGIFYGINTTAVATYTNLYGNKVTNNSIPGTGTMYCIYDIGSSATVLQSNIYNNIVSGNSHTGTSGALYMCYASATTQLVNFYNNQLFNNSNATSSGLTYGYYNFGSGYGENVYNNQVYNCTGGTGSEFVGLYTRDGASGTDKQIYGNSVYNLTGGNQVGAIYEDYATNLQMYNNNIYNISSTATALAPATYGIQIGTNINQNVNVYNNFISELKAPANSNINSIYGIWFLGLSATTGKIYYNTIYLNASSSAPTFGTSAVLLNSTPTSVDLRNNILVNASTPGTTGRTIAIQRNTTTLTNYNTLSGNNCLFAGTPGVSNVIYFDGTNADQTLQAFKDRMGTRDQASFTEIPPFVNIGASPYDLHIQTGIATQVEKGGQPVNVTTDYDGITRSATFPDAGADEFTGTFTDNASPLIIYTPLGIGSTGSSRSVPNFAVITDPSNVNTTAGTRPRIYYKKSTQTNIINDNTSGTDGWKWVEASNTSSPYSFTIDYTILFGGSVAAADVIQYFVIAQDLNGTPRVGVNAAAFPVQPTSVNLAAANTPIVTTNTNTYTIAAGISLSGTVSVGTGADTYASLTNAGGLFAAINSSGLSGNLVVNISTDLTSELGTNALNQWSETGVGNYTVTIQPGTGTLKTIAGITATNGLIRLDGADRVSIDGRFGGTGQFLRFRNYSTTGSGLLLLNDAQNNVIRNCIFEGNSTGLSGNGAGSINIGSTTLLNGNDNNTITFNEIRDRSDSVKTSAIGIFCGGNTISLPQYNNNCVISNNNIHDFFVDASASLTGVLVSTGNSNFNIDSNSVYMTTTKTFTTGTTGAYTGILVSNSAVVASNGGFNIRRNYVGGSAPLCAGTAWTQTVTGTATGKFNGINVISGLIPNFIQNNTVANIDYTSNGVSASTIVWSGIGTGNGIHNITGNTIGSTTGNDNIKVTSNGSSAGFSFCRAIMLASFTSTIYGGNIDNNTVGSVSMGGTCTPGGFVWEGISLYTSPGVLSDVSMSNNLIGSTTTPNSIRTTYNVTNPQSQLLNMRIVTPTGVNVTCNNNTFQNITEGSASTSTLMAGILQSASTSSSVNPILTNNTFANFTSNTSAAFSNDIVAIQTANSSVNENISGNTITNFNLSNTGAVNTGEIGLSIQNNSSGGTISKNKIYGLTNQTTGSGSIFGTLFFAGNIYTVSNNMISLTNGQPTDDLSRKMISTDNHVDMPNNDHTIYKAPAKYDVPANYNPANEKQPETVQSLVPLGTDEFIKNENYQANQNSKTSDPNFTNNVTIYGVLDQSSASNMQALYNTIYVGGTSGTLNSYCYYRFANATTTLKNNLFYNNRTGSGFHYAVGNVNGTPSAGWLAGASNYNAFVTTDSNYVGEWGSGSNKSIDLWRTSSLGDNQTWSTKTSVIAPTNLFTNVAAGDLHILSGNAEAWLVSGKGIALTGQGTDYDNTARSTTIAGGVTDIGADEFTATPPGNPVALQSGAPGSGLTTDYTLYGRKIATINWGTGGTYPTSMNVNYFSGVNPVNLGTFTPRYSNSYWTINPASGTFSGTTYDATIYFGDNETFNITSPSTNTILGKNDNTSTTWFTYGPGVGNKQTELNWNALTAKVRGLNSFSNFALSDDAYPPSPLLLSPTNNSTAVPVNVTLTWNKSFGAGTYKVQVATDSLFTSPAINDSTVTDTTRIATGLVINTQYWWRVRGKNGTGIGLYSEIWKFNTTPALAPPPPPVLVSPPNNSTGQSITPLLVWNRSTAAATYRVQLATDAGFTNIILNDSTVTDSTRLAGTLAPLTNYWWRINAKNAAGTSAFSTAFTFKTIGPASGFTLINPPNNSTGQPINILFTWHSAIDQTLLSMSKDKGKGNGDNVNVVSTYFYERVTDTVTLANRVTDSTLTDTTKNVVGLNYLTKYFWRVKAKNQVGYGPFTGWFNFTTTVQPAAVVNLTVIPGGFYNTGTGTLNMRDTVRVYLLDSATCVKMDSAKVVLDSVTFSASPNFNIANTGNYYIVVKHRNHIIVASRLKQTVTRGSTVAYNFVSDSSNTFANNVIKVSNSPVRWAMIPGDANQDQFVDGLDQTLWIIQNGSEGYFSADFNGDGFVDGLDQTVWILFNGNSSFLPCAFPDYYVNPNTKQHVVIDNRTTQKIFNNNSNQDAKKGNK